jgi:hypothetical protein
MSSLVPQVEAVRAVLRAEDYQQLSAAAASPVIKGMGVNVSSIAGLEKSITDDLQKTQTEDPEKFSKDVEELKKKFPDMQATNDVELLKKAAFAAVKAPAQESLMKMMDDRTRMIMSSMELPIDPKVRALLIQTPEGKQYVSAMDELQRRLEGAAQQIKK